MSDPTDEVTVVEAIDSLRRAGFTADFSVAAGGMVRCVSCGTLHEPGELVVDATIRVEGVSDPDDEAVVFGLTCARCLTHGVLVAAYGPTASSDEAAVITALRDPGA